MSLPHPDRSERRARLGVRAAPLASAGLCLLALAACGGGSGEATNAGAGAGATAIASGVGAGPGVTGVGGAGGSGAPTSTGALPPPPSCSDEVLGESESDVDCGGTCAPCAPGRRCNDGSDCVSDRCEGGLCATSSASGGLPGTSCVDASDCVSSVCTGGECQVATSTDGVKNGLETGVDCGGPSGAPPCGAGEGCVTANDCDSLVCTASKCAGATATDGVKNGAESDVDCGGAAAPACGEGLQCFVGADCTTGVCAGGTCQGAQANDGVKNGSETDVDCGGGAAPACGAGMGCKQATDCDSVNCAGGTCQAATATDGIQNQGETDVDCGGPIAPKCANGRLCIDHTDCQNDACNYAKKCIARRSCVYKDGGETCGAGETGTAAAENADCCEAIEVPMANGKKPKLDKYLITAGRFRAFIDRVGGNVRSVVDTVPPPPGWDAAWTKELPANLEETYWHLGPFKDDPNGCYHEAFGVRTYHQPPNPSWPKDHEYYLWEREVYDRKVMNCVNWYMLAAFCIWDGGRLPTGGELQRAWRGTAASRAYPWGTGTNFYERALAYENNERKGGAKGKPPPFREPAAPPAGLEAQFYASTHPLIIAPGRSTKGAGPFGHMDLAGLLFNLGGWNGKFQRLASGSWDAHDIQVDATVTDVKPLQRYWATGARCARD